jgi:hypothetical protein
MSPIPSEPHKSRPQDVLTLKDGTKVRIKFPGMPPAVKPVATEERGAAEPPRDNPAPLHNPNHGAV